MKEKEITISRKKIGGNNPVYIIAEAGVNHNGSLKLAKKLVDAAKATGADAVKFQAFRAELLVTRGAPTAAYQKKQSADHLQFEMLKRLELSENDFIELNDYCLKKNIVFLATPFDEESLVFLAGLGVPAFKLSSGDLTNLPFIKQMAGYKKPLIISSGMANMAEVKEAVRAARSAENHKLILLHCTSRYPAKYNEVNLKAIVTLKKIFGVPTGYSDHTPGIEISIAAVALGSCLIEKHFTLDTKMVGPDHAASLAPTEFGQMVNAIRHIESSLGDGIKRPYLSELEIKRVAQKSIVVARDLVIGATIYREDLAVKRPGTGLPPKYLPSLVGRRAVANLKKDTLLRWENVR